MPHIHIRSFNPVSFPAKRENVSFHFMASNVAHDDEHLISTTIDDKEFFIEKGFDRQQFPGILPSGQSLLRFIPNRP